MIRHTIITIVCTLCLIPSIAVDIVDKSETKQFDLILYHGKIDKYPISMILHYYSDRKIEGCYWYESTGKLLDLRTDINDKLDEIKLYGKDFSNLDNINSEMFSFKITDKNKIFGTWKSNGTEFKFDLTADSTLSQSVRILDRYSAIFNDSYFNRQIGANDFVLIGKNHPKLRHSILRQFVPADLPKYDYLFQQTSEYMIIENHYGEQNKEDSNELHEYNRTGRLLYFADSILSYEITHYTYGNNGYTYKDAMSFFANTGAKVEISNIFRDNTEEEVKLILESKYKKMLEQEEYGVTTNNYNFNSDFVLTNTGIYFRHSSFNNAPYIGLFLTFNEIKHLMKDEFKNKICP